MKIIFFSHPDFLDHVSMPRFTNMLAEGMRERGHEVEVWAPRPKFYNIPSPVKFKKWLGYLDQFLVFPNDVKKRKSKLSADTLFVITDHALGPWVPLVADRPHVIHCHDFLAQQSALGQIKEHLTGWSGRKYQSMIRDGYTKGKNFISGSENTRQTLHKFLHTTPRISELVYNGLNQTFEVLNPDLSRKGISDHTGIDLTSGYILHVGGNQWYKNREGVIEIYNSWRNISKRRISLLLIGIPPSEYLKSIHLQSPFKNDIHFVSGLKDASVRIAYAGASVLLFPSKAEGFGWPIAEAMASGCPVITTNERPMTEVAGDAGFLISRRPTDTEKLESWQTEGARVLNSVLSLTTTEREKVIERGIVNANRFDTKLALDKIEMIYKNIVASSK